MLHHNCCKYALKAFLYHQRKPIKLVDWNLQKSNSSDEFSDLSDFSQSDESEGVSADEYGGELVPLAQPDSESEPELSKGPQC